MAEGPPSVIALLTASCPSFLTSQQPGTFHRFSSLSSAAFATVAGRVIDSNVNHRFRRRSSLDSRNIHPIRYNGVHVAEFNPARRAFHASATRQRDHHFDTLKFVKRLRAEGFSEEQAAAMMRILNDVIQESIQNLTRTMVLKEGTPASAYLFLFVALISFF